MHMYADIPIHGSRNSMVLIASSRKKAIFLSRSIKVRPRRLFADIFHIEPIQLPFFYHTLFLSLDIYFSRVLLAARYLVAFATGSVNVVPFFFHGFILIDIRETRDIVNAKMFYAYVSRIYSPVKYKFFFDTSMTQVF